MKVRVELGPRDAQKSQACLAISTTPGEVAKKSSYQVHSLFCSALACLHKVIRSKPELVVHHDA